MSLQQLQRNIFELQPLEIRRLLTTAFLDGDHRLHILGTNSSESITVNKLSNGRVSVSGVGTTFLPGNSAGQFNNILIEASGGNDTILITSNVRFSNGAGIPAVIGGGNGHDVITSGRGNDQINGNDGDDVLDGGVGNDLMTGGNGLDTANYTNRPGAVRADSDGVADDGEVAIGEADNVNCEEILGGAGNDSLTGTGASDFLTGGAGADSLVGNSGNDELLGGTGIDRLFGNAGDDYLHTLNNDAGDSLASGSGNFDFISVDPGDVGIAGDSAARDEVLAEEALVGSGAGDLDATYGGNGTGVNHGPDLDWNQITASAVDSQGRAVFVGYDFTGDGYGGDDDFVVARYNADGTFDTTFGTNGEVRIDFTDIGSGYGEDDDRAYGVAIGPNDSIVVVGEHRNSFGSSSVFAVAQLLSSGAPMPGFGDTGRVLIDIPGSGYGYGDDDIARDAVALPDGRIVVAGGSHNGQYDTFAVAQLLPDGQVAFANSADFGQFATGYAVALQDLSGLPHIIVGGDVAGSWGLARFNPAGGIDTSFGTGGTMTQSFSGFAHLSDLAVNAASEIIAVGNTQNFIIFDAPNPSPGESEAIVARFAPQGTMITAVGESSLSGSFLHYNAVTIDGAERVVVAGSDGEDYVVARYDSALAHDPFFSSDNYVNFDLGAESFDDALGLRVLANGKIVVGGYTDECGDGCYVFSAARLNGQGQSEFDPIFTYEEIHQQPPPFPLNEHFGHMSETARRYLLWQPDENGVARINLSDSDNTIVISLVKAGDKSRNVAVNVDGIVAYYDPDATPRIEIYGNGGNDTFTIDGNIKTDLLILGGEGDDTIEGAAGNDVLVGGPGDDVVAAGQGSDIVIGGTGADELHGSAKEDLIIAGSTAHDGDVAALLALSAEWASKTAIDARINNLRSGGGLNGGTILQAQVTVFDDSAIDLIDGKGAKDWIFLKLDGPDADILLGGNGNTVLEAL